MFQAALNIDLLMGRDVGKPSMDDWNSFSKCAGRTCFFLVVHQLLARLLSRIFVEEKPSKRKAKAGGCEL